MIELPACRLTKENGPTHTGEEPKSSPSLVSWAGDMTIPARSASWPVSGANGAFRVSFTVVGSTTSTPDTAASSLLRAEPSIETCRSSEVLTAAASNGVPSLNVTPVRSVMVTDRPSVEISGSAAASCGTMARLSSTS